MTFSYMNNLNTNPYMRCQPRFKAQQQPADEQSDSPIEKLAEKIEEEKKKKHNQKALAVGGSVIGLSLLVALFNPRFSTKLIEKLKTARLNTGKRLERSKNSFIKTNFYKVTAKAADWSAHFLSWINNFNSVKDTYFKRICTEKKEFSNVKNTKMKEFLQKVDNVIRKIFHKPHEVITHWGDILAQKTVRHGYKTSAKKMDKLEQLLIEYSEKLPSDKKELFNKKLEEIRSQREFFSQTNLNNRFKQYEDSMSGLNGNIRTHWNQYKDGFVDKNVKTLEHFNNHLSFWAQDIMHSERELAVKQGKSSVDKLMGNLDGEKGSYREIINLISENLSKEEQSIIKKKLTKAEKSLRKANKRECGDYFDKKRDLVLGSAPTDIVTAIAGLTFGGVALATADNKDDRLSRLFTGILPTIAGLGTSIALTTMLFSGIKGLAIGFGTSGLLSLTGSKLDKHRLALKNQSKQDVSEIKDDKKEETVA